jgi:hypothetical protein
MGRGRRGGDSREFPVPRGGTKKTSTNVSRVLAGARTRYLSKVSLQHYLPGFLEVKFPRFTRAALDGGRVVSVTHRPPLPSSHKAETEQEVEILC